MKVNTTSLARALTQLQAVAGKRTTLPVLNCVRVEARNSVLTLQATNLECYVSLDLPCVGNLAACCVPARVFKAVVGQGDETELSLVKGRLHVKADSSAVEIPVLDAAEFPPCLEVKEAVLAVDCPELATAIQKAGYAFSTEQGRPALHNVLFESSQGEMNVCTTDGRRMVRALIPCDAELKFLVPASEVAQFVDALQGEDAKLRISENWARVDHKSGFAQVKLSEHAMVNFKQVIPRDFEPFGKVNRLELIAALDMCMGFTTDLVFAVMMEPRKGGLYLWVKSEQGAVDTTVKGEFTPREAMKANPDHLRTALRHLEGDEVAIAYPDAKSPAVIIEDNITAIVMPYLQKK